MNFNLSFKAEHCFSKYEKYDRASICFLFIFTYLMSLFLCYELYLSGFYSYINIAFDLDQSWYFDIITRAPEHWIYKGESMETPLNVKHPFLYILRIPTEFLQLFGMNEEISGIVTTLFFVSMTPVVFYLCARMLKNTQLNSFLLTLIFIFSTTFVVNAQVLDSYSIAQFWIITAVFIFIRCISLNILDNSWGKAFVYVAMVGTTSYLILLVILCELLILTKNRGKGHSELIGYAKTIIFKSTMLFIFFFVAIYYEILIALILDPVGVLKSVLWAVARPGEKSGIETILEVFFLTSFIAPPPTLMNLGDGTIMLDYRSYEFSWYTIFTVALLISVFVIAIKSEISYIYSLSLLWFLINVLFHIVYQDRGSLFLYTGHIFPLVALFISNALKFNERANNSLLFLILFIVLFNNFRILGDLEKSIQLNSNGNPSVKVVIKSDDLI